MDAITQINNLMGDPLGIAGIASSALAWLGSVMLLFGLLQACWGLKLFKVYCAIGGLALGAVLGFLLGGVATEDVGIAFVCAIIFGILGAIVAFKVYQIGVFLNVFVMGTVLGIILSRLFVIGIILGLILAVVAIFFVKPVIIITSGLSGGAMAGFGMAALIGQANSAAITIFSFLFAAGGMLLQFSMERKKLINTDGRPATALAPMAASPMGQTGATPTYTPPNVRAVDVDSAHPMLNTLLAKEIYDELSYIFPVERRAKLLYLPEMKEDGAWCCSCGAQVPNEDCRICGMTRTEADKVFNFAYLSAHRTERLQQEEAHQQEVAERRRQMAEQKKDELKKTAQNVMDSAAKGGAVLREKSTVVSKQFAGKARQFWSKVLTHKKIVFPVAGGVLALLVVGIALFSNSTIRASYYNSKGDKLVEQDPSAAGTYYSKALEEKENPDSYIGLAHVLEQNGEPYQVGELLGRGLEQFPEDNKMQTAYDAIRPGAVRFSVAGGTFTDLMPLELTAEAKGDGTIIFYQLDDGVVMPYSDPILFNQPGDYRVTAWTRNHYELSSDKVYMDYQMDLPIPKQASFSLVGGDYTAVQQITLAAPTGTAIYYTLDGSDPNLYASRYDKPIDCGFGVTHIRAICYNDIGVPSPVTESTYRVAYPTHGSTFGYGARYSGFYYDYGAQGDTIFLMDKNSGETRAQLNGNTPTMLCEYGEYLYYVTARREIMRYDLNTAEYQLVAPVNAAVMWVAQDRIYYTDANTGYLYRMGLDGQNSQSVLEQFTNQLDCYDGKLYFVTADGIFSIADANATPTPYFKGIVSAYAISEASLFYIQNGNLYKQTNGQTDTLREASASEDREEPYGLNNGYISSDKEEHNGLILHNRTLYYRTKIENSIAPINWLDKQVVERKRSTDQNIQWNKLNLDDKSTTTFVGQSTNLYVMDKIVITENVQGVWTQTPVVH